MADRARRDLRRLLLGLTAASAVAVLAGCGPVDVTQAKLQADFGPTFRNMYVFQQQLLGHTPQTVPARVSKARCVKGGNGTPDDGPGDNWTCLVDWPAADGHIEGLTYEVDVKPEGCYTAQGPATYVGQQTMRAADGRSVTNPLFEFDGCLDTS
jgi:hypothetical protein